MAIHQHELLSIWEVAHRWLGLDPDAVPGDALSLECRDLLRDLCAAIESNLRIFDSNREEIVDSFLPFLNLEFPAKARKAVERMATVRQFDRAQLDSVYLLKDDVCQWCIYQFRAFPHFWLRSDELKYFCEKWVAYWGDAYTFAEAPSGLTAGGIANVASKDQPPRNTRKASARDVDRAACQKAALELWSAKPNATIAELIASTTILQAGGSLYKPKTLRLWLSEVDPRRIEQKRGRPKRNQ